VIERGVYLIGAGPGDPGLLTVRGLECLRSADVVIHDHLIPARLLKESRPDAELLDVGTAAPQSMAQQAISILIAEKAREGKIVARLKRGDPFVFDRGGEEALFLHEQGIPFEVVPGITAGLAGPPYAGVPVYYPGGGETITLVRAGYDDEGRTLPDVDWQNLAKLEGTVICYVGSQLPRILETMLSKGWAGEESAAVVYNGTQPNQETLSGTLTSVLQSVREHPRRDPAILVIGRVVGFREHLRWFDARPLFGRRVLVTRARDQAAELVDRLTALGAEPIEAPMIRIDPPDDPAPLQRAAENPADFDWIVFTSANAVEALMDAILEGHRDVRALQGPRLCTVGTGTADRLARYGIKVDVIPEEFRAEAVVTALAEYGPLARARVLLPRSDIGREVVAEQLRDAGALVTDVVAYRTVLEEVQREDEPDIYGMLLEGRIDVVTFTSASAVRNFVRIYGSDQAVDLLNRTAVAAIGPVTAEAARQLGIAVAVQPAAYTIEGLVDAIAAYFSAAKSASR
jgi:uroporphyrinogen III methyltransferase/synthase